jgi:hypothetical protein
MSHYIFVEIWQLRDRWQQFKRFRIQKLFFNHDCLVKWLGRTTGLITGKVRIFLSTVMFCEQSYFRVAALFRRE